MQTDHRGRPTYPHDRSLLPDDLAAQLADIEAAAVKVETLIDAVDIARRKIKAAKEADAEAIRKVVEAGRDIPSTYDAQERKAVAEVKRAEIARDAAKRALADAERPLIAAVRAAMPEVEQRAASKAAALGEEYRETLEKARRLRNEYDSVLGEWREALFEIAVQRHIVEHPERRGNIDEARPGWSPNTVAYLDRPQVDIGAIFGKLIAEDCTRHVRPAPRVPSDRERRFSQEFAAATEADL